MLKCIEVFLDCLIMFICLYISSTKILKSKYYYSKLTLAILTILASLILTYINIVNLEIFYGVIKILSVYILFTLYCKMVFNEKIFKSTITALIWYLCLIFCEAVIGLLASLILNLMGVSLDILKNNFLANLLISISTTGLIYLLRNRLSTFVKNKRYVEISTIIITAIILITLALIGFKRPITDWHFDSELGLTMLLLLCFSIVGLYILKQRSIINKTSMMYQLLAENSNMTNKVLEEYRMVNHEHKNQLSIIRQMTNKNNKKLIEYLDTLLEQKNNIKYKWISDINHISLSGLRGLINYKLVEMEEGKINISVDISKEIKNIKFNKLKNNQIDNLYSIIGVYLDNAKEAAFESKEKEVSISIYKDKESLVIIIGNTYKENIDINKIDEYGYSSKGKNRGVGLHIVRKIIEDNEIFSENRKIIDNYYIQELIVHLNK